MALAADQPFLTNGVKKIRNRPVVQHRRRFARLVPELDFDAVALARADAFTRSSNANRFFSLEVTTACNSPADNVNPWVRSAVRSPDTSVKPALSSDADESGACRSTRLSRSLTCLARDGSIFVNQRWRFSDCQ